MSTLTAVSCLTYHVTAEPHPSPSNDDRMDIDLATAHSTTEPKPPSRSAFAFFDLPAELRTQIYEELLVSDASFRLGHHGPFCLVERKPTWPAIMQTCKRAREEAAPVLYGANSFFLGTIGFKPIYSFSFFASIGPKNASLIRKLVAHSTYPSLTTRSHLQHWIESLGIDFNRLKVLAISFETKPIEVTAMPQGAAPIGVPLQAQLPPPVAANATLQSQNQAPASSVAVGNATNQAVNMLASAMIGATAAMSVAVAANGAQSIITPTAATTNALWATNNIVSSVLQMQNHNWAALPSTVAIPTASVIPSAHTVSLHPHSRTFRFSVKDDDGQYELCARREQLWLQKATTRMVQEFANVPNCDLRAGDFWLMYKDPRVRKLPNAR